LSALTSGQALGPAVLRMRRELLRRQYNPLGLAYSFFGSAALHLCPGADCPHCAVPAP
jgi:hypothetical protein